MRLARREALTAGHGLHRVAPASMQLAAMLRQQSNYLPIPIVFLSSEVDLAKQITAMQEGGDDFLLKSTPPEYLVALVKSHAKRSRVVSSFARRDGLTGLLNHASTKEHLELELLVEAGLSPQDVIRIATLNAARVLRIEKDYGSIEKGKIADLLILDANPMENIQNTRKISAVYKAGQVISRGPFSVE